MRNRWFPARVANYVTAIQLKQLKKQDLEFARDFSYGVRENLEEEEEDEEVVAHQRYVRPIEIDVLSVCADLPFYMTDTDKASLSDPWSSSTRLSHPPSTSSASASSRKGNRDSDPAHQAQLIF